MVPESSKSAPRAHKYIHTAYLLSRYPAVSHTFFLKEIEGLRQLGFKIETASINLPDRPSQDLTGPEQSAQETTFYIKGRKTIPTLLKLGRVSLLRPSIVLRGLKAALRLQPGHLTRSIYALFYLAEALLLGEWLTSKNVRHLHIHFSGPVASVGMLTAIAWKIPYSMTVHGPDEFFDQNESALAQKVGGAAFVICISHYCMSQLMRITSPASWHKFHVVRLGVPPVSNKPDRSVNPGSFKILCTGRLVAAKGQAILLMALALLRDRGYKTHLTLIGNGPDRAELEALSAQLGLANDVHFAGPQNHDLVLQALNHADLFVLPSFAEGVPVALMEAMAHCVPCISTFIAGIPELIRHEQDGLLVPAGSIEDLADAIERMMAHPAERERFSASALEQVTRHYNLPVNLELLSQVWLQEAPHASQAPTT